MHYFLYLTYQILFLLCLHHNTFLLDSDNTLKVRINFVLDNAEIQSLQYDICVFQNTDSNDERRSSPASNRKNHRKTTRHLSNPHVHEKFLYN